tara:strand:+ start:314 stop:568 length:255 start_codon:yes stop_codon:yes gene_type:complete
MNETQARMIIKINQVDLPNRNVYFLAAKMDKSHSTVYNYLRIMANNGYVSKVKSGNRSYWTTNEDALELALRVIGDVSQPKDNN